MLEKKKEEEAEAAEATEPAEEVTEPIAEPAEEVKEPTEGLSFCHSSFLEDYYKEVRRLRKKIRQADELAKRKEAGATLKYL